jgi:hypothetical protein
MTQYRIEWSIIQNNYGGVGPWHNSKEVIESWVKYLNKKYHGDIQHWIGEK